MPPTAVIAIVVVLLLLVIGVIAWMMLASDSPSSDEYGIPPGAEVPPGTDVPPGAPPGAPSGVPPVAPVQQWQSKARQDITPGVNMWVLSGNVDACKAKCGPDPNCKAFTINSTNSRCWGKNSAQYSNRATGATAWVKL